MKLVIKVNGAVHGAKIYKVAKDITVEIFTPSKELFVAAVVGSKPRRGRKTKD